MKAFLSDSSHTRDTWQPIKVESKKRENLVYNKFYIALETNQHAKFCLGFNLKKKEMWQPKRWIEHASNSDACHCHRIHQIRRAWIFTFNKLNLKSVVEIIFSQKGSKSIIRTILNNSSSDACNSFHHGFMCLFAWTRNKGTIFTKFYNKIITKHKLYFNNRSPFNGQSLGKKLFSKSIYQSYRLISHNTYS